MKFIDRILKIAEWVDTYARTIKPEPRADIAKAIDTAIGHDAPIVQYIRDGIARGIPKTPLYFLHSFQPDKVGKKWRGKAKVLPKSQRMRKQNFLALYDYLAQEEEEKEVEETTIRCYRDAVRNEETGNTYIGVNLYFISTPLHLDSIEGFMERIRDVFKFAVEVWTPELEYEESEISDCEAPDTWTEAADSGFVFEISSEMKGDWEYYGVWYDREWQRLKIYSDFSISAVTNLLLRAQL